MSINLEPKFKESRLELVNNTIYDNFKPGIGFKSAQIKALCPDVSERTVTDALRGMVNSGELVSIGDKKTRIYMFQPDIFSPTGGGG